MSQGKWKMHLNPAVISQLSSQLSLLQLDKRLFNDVEKRSANNFKRSVFRGDDMKDFNDPVQPVFAHCRIQHFICFIGRKGLLGLKCDSCIIWKLEELAENKPALVTCNQKFRLIIDDHYLRSRGAGTHHPGQSISVSHKS